jgi:hypothetical protein
MARNAVHRARRLSVLFTVAHKAGDLAYSSATALGGAGATAAYRAVGRTIATGNATVADVQLFNPNQL